MYSKSKGERDRDGHRYYEIQAPANTFVVGCKHPEDEHARCTHIKVDKDGTYVLNEQGEMTYIFTTKFQDDLEHVD